MFKSGLSVAEVIILGSNQICAAAGETINVHKGGGCDGAQQLQSLNR
jgi:hypothetical protein